MIHGYHVIMPMYEPTGLHSFAEGLWLARTANEGVFGRWRYKPAGERMDHLQKNA